MNRQLSALPDSKTTRIILPYNRQYVIFAVYEVLDKNGAEYEKTDASTILAEMSVYGNLSRFSVSVNEQETGTDRNNDTSLRGTVRCRYPKGNDRHSRQYIAAFGKRA